MRRHSKILGLAAIAGSMAMLASGCGDARTVSSKNLQQALNLDYSTKNDCLFSRPLPFPMEVAVNDGLLAETRHKLDALAGAGLLIKEQVSRNGTDVNSYALTESGRKAAGKGRFCYGRREVTSVEHFTAPVEYQGMPLTRVEYHFVLKSNADWVKSEQLQSAFPALARSLSEEPVDQATLILTTEGWEVAY